MNSQPFGTRTSVRNAGQTEVCIPLIPARMPGMIQMFGVANESWVTLYKAIASQAKSPAMPRKRKKFPRGRRSSVLARIENRKTKNKTKPTRPVSASRRTYKFLGLGNNRLCGFSCLAISGTVVRVQSGRLP